MDLKMTATNREINDALLALARESVPPLLNCAAGEFTADDWIGVVLHERGYRPAVRTARTQLTQMAQEGRLSCGARFDPRTRRQVIAYWFPGPVAQEEHNGGKNE